MVGGRGRPSKPREETARGQAELKRLRKRAAKEAKEQRKAENVSLAAQGCFRDKDGGLRRYKSVGKEGGTLAWEDAPSPQKRARIEAGREGGAAAWTEASEVEREARMAASIEGGRAEWQAADEPGRERLRNVGAAGGFAGSVAHLNFTEEQQLAQMDGRNRGKDMQSLVASFNYENTPGIPKIKAQPEVWECQGVDCNLSCVEDVTLLSFVGLDDITLQRWMVSHKMMDSNCNSTCHIPDNFRLQKCGGQCVPVSLSPTKVALKCQVCHTLSIGGLRGFWRMGRIGITKMAAIVFSIVNGVSQKVFTEVFGVKVNRNTYSKYIYDVGMVCGEELHRKRKDPSQKFVNCQIDETAFGKRKYHRGRRVRNAGVQWALTFAEVDSETGKTTQVDMQFLPYNKRSNLQITPMVCERVARGGTITTDSWKAYPPGARAAGVDHKIVNHAEAFVQDGIHTNNVEGVHGVVKNDGRKMFGRLPYLSDRGQSYYLDILIWRLNVRLQKARYFTEYLRCLYRWTWAPCEDYENFTPVFHDNDGDEG